MRIVLADDHGPLREALSALLADEPGAEVVGEAADGAECLRLVGEMRPDLVLMDVRMPRVDGVEATKRIRERHPGVRVVALTSFEDTEHVAGMIAAGASGYLLKSASGADLRAAVRGAVEGRPVMSPEVFERVLADVAARYRAQESQVEMRQAGDRMHRALLTVVSDQLRNPLTAVTGAAATLQRDWERLDDDTRRALLAQLDQQAARLAARVEDVIAVVAEEPGDGTFLLSDAAQRALGEVDGLVEDVRLEPVRARGDPAAAVTVIASVLGGAIRRWGRGVALRTLRDPADRAAILELRDAGEASARTEGGSPRRGALDFEAVRHLLATADARMEHTDDRIALRFREA